MAARVRTIRAATILLLLASVGGHWLGLARAARAEAAPATMDQIRKQHDAGEWSAALRSISETTRPRGASAAKGDRYEIMMIKGDCLLHLKNPRTAATAYEEALREAASPQARASARASALLCRRVTGTHYVPRASPADTTRAAAGGAGGIDVIDSASRQRAMIALYDDVRAQHERQLESAASAPTLEPILAAIPTLRDLYALEVTSTGKAVRTEPLMRTLGAQARELMEAELKRIRLRAGELHTQANDLTVFVGDVTQRGLTSAEQDELRSSIAYVERIAETAREGRRSAQMTDGPVDEWDRVLAQCGDLVDEIRLVLAGPGPRSGKSGG